MALSSSFAAQKTPLRIVSLFGHLKYSPRPASPVSPGPVVATAMDAAATGAFGDNPETTAAQRVGANSEEKRKSIVIRPVAVSGVKVEDDEDDVRCLSPSRSNYFAPDALHSSSKKRKIAVLPVAAKENVDADEGGFIPDHQANPPKKVFAKFRPFASPEKYEHLGGITDHISWENDVVCCGINPGVSSAAKGHHYAGPTNRFWPCMHQSGLVPDVVTYKDDARLPRDYNIGLTNLVARPTTSASELSAASDMRPGVPLLLAKILRFRPQIVCFVGKDIWREVQFVLTAAERRKVGRKKVAKKEKIEAGWDEPRTWKVVHPRDGAGQVRETYFWAVSSTSGLCRDTMDQRRSAWTKLNAFKLEILRRRAIDPASVTAVPIDSCNLGALSVVDVNAVSEWVAEYQEKIALKKALSATGRKDSVTARGEAAAEDL